MYASIKVKPNSDFSGTLNSRSITEGIISNNSKIGMYRKKCYELSELDVPIEVVYSIKINGITVLMLSKHNEEILQSPEWLDGEDYTYHQSTVKLARSVNIIKSRY